MQQIEATNKLGMQVGSSWPKTQPANQPTDHQFVIQAMAGCNIWFTY